MKSSAWRISAYSCLAAALLFISSDIASADTLLGKVTLVRADGITDVYPVISGKRIAYPQQALIRLTGATFVAEEGSVLEVSDQDGSFSIGVEKGIIHFRIQPHKAAVSFATKDGSFDTPRIVTASRGVIEGTIKVDERGTTVELIDGSLSVVTSDGVKTLSAGEGIVLAQSSIEGETEEVVVDMPSEGTGAGESSVSEDTKKADYTAAAVMGTVTAGAVTGVIIGVTTGNGGGGDSVASPIE